MVHSISWLVLHLPLQVVSKTYIKRGLSSSDWSCFFSEGIFIGSSFVFKKKGLLESNQKSGKKNSLSSWRNSVDSWSYSFLGRDAGDDYGYLKSPMWWSGMILSKVTRKEKEDDLLVEWLYWLFFYYDSGGWWSM